jgi:hypothetical protein
MRYSIINDVGRDQVTVLNHCEPNRICACLLQCRLRYINLQSPTYALNGTSQRVAKCQLTLNRTCSSHSVTRCSHGRLAQAAPFLTLLSSLECTYSIIDRRSYHQAQQEALGQRNELLKYYTATAVFTLPPTLLLIWVGLMKFNGRHV